MAEKHIFVVDIGASRVSAALAICSKVDKIFDLLFESIKRSTRSRQDKYGTELSDYILSLKTSLEKKSNCHLRDVSVNIDSVFVNCQISRAAMALVDKERRRVTSSDVKKIKQQASNLSLKIDEESLHEFPIQFILDSEVATLSPVDKLARKLEIDLLQISAKSAGIETLTKIIEQTGLKLKSIKFSGLACAAAILDPLEMKEDVIVIDVGAASTKFVNLLRMVPQRIKIINFGADNITDCLANTLKIPFDLAQELKKAYGSVTSENLESDKEIMIKTSNSYKPIRCGELCKAILPSVEKLIYFIKEYLDTCLKPNSEIFVCGGMSLLDGFLEILESKINHPVKLGLPIVEYLPLHKRNSFFKSPAQATLLGLVRLGLGDYLFSSPYEVFGHVHALSKTFQKARKIYYEYF